MPDFLSRSWTAGVAIVTVGAIGLAWTGATHRAGELPRRSTVERQGYINGWSITADGSVAIRLVDDRATGPGKETVWFITPASRTATTQFEELVLTAALEVATSGAGVAPQPPNPSPVVVTARGDISNEESGRTADEAIPLLSLARR